MKMSFKNGKKVSMTDAHVLKEFLSQYILENRLDSKVSMEITYEKDDYINFEIK